MSLTPSESKKILCRILLESYPRRRKRKLELLGVKVEKPSTPFPEIRFPEVYDILREYGKIIPFGEEPNREGEAILAKHVKEKTKSDFFFENRFPFNVKPFYVMRDDADPRWARSVDLVYKGMELSSGGQREHRHAEVDGTGEDQGPGRIPDILVY